MNIRAAFRKGSLILPCTAYVLVVLLIDLSIRWVLKHDLMYGTVSALLLLGAIVVLFVHLTFEREEDWLIAGVVIYLTVSVGGWIAGAILAVLLDHQAIAVLQALPRFLLATLWRALLWVPIYCSLVAAARYIADVNKPTLVRFRRSDAS